MANRSSSNSALKKPMIIHDFHIPQKLCNVGNTSTAVDIQDNGMNEKNVESNANLLHTKKLRRKPRSRKSPANSMIQKSFTELNSIITKCDNSFLEMKLEDTVVLDECESNTSFTPLLNEFEIKAIKSQVTGRVLNIKKNFYHHINRKFLKYLNEGNLKSSTCCKCNCHHVSNSRDNDKFAPSSSKNVCNGITSPLLPTPLFVNRLNLLQLQDVTKTSQDNISTKTLKKKKKKAKKEKRYPTKELSLTDVRIGLEAGLFIQGIVRINAKHFHEAYVSSNNEDESDYLIPSVIDRNRALEGDVVAIKLKNEKEWTERLKTAYVVRILEYVHPRTAVGFLQTFPYTDAKYAAFIPRDIRIPRMRIPIKSCPQGFNRNAHRFENMLYKGQIVDWVDVQYANGILLENLGFSGDLESETSAILAEYGLDTTPFKPDPVGLSKITDSIPIGEFAYREDLRKECIFTIDPLTARDLDDAVSCKELSNGNLEIGVHISDVSFYLTENSSLDKIVRKKATTIYMVNNVYHMLPEELCLHCSLLPGKDKLAFSIFWEMTKSGEVISQRCARTVINSCVQLAYEHAQAMIENPNRRFTPDELPAIHGGFTPFDLSKIVNYLQTIAVNLRNKRFENGSLRIDQIKLLFRIDETTGEPNELLVYENKEAHRLIEEFMLLANICIATKIANTFPDKAFLRCHDPPKLQMLVELKKTLNNFDIHLDISSSKALASSMKAISETSGIAKMAVLNHLLAKPMVRARYFCSGDANVDDFTHYALSVPIYTHFTSPIRRYADIMVHRLLSASLNYTEEPNWNSQYVTSVANNCNRKKYNAKCAGDASSDLYLAHYITEHQPFVRDAIIIDIKLTSFEILVFSTGSIIKMFTNALGKDIDCEVNQEDNKKLMVVFNATPEHPKLTYEMGLFSVVTVALNRKPKTIKLEATLMRPITSCTFTNQV